LLFKIKPVLRNFSTQQERPSISIRKEYDSLSLGISLNRISVLSTVVSVSSLSMAWISLGRSGEGVLGTTQSQS